MALAVVNGMDWAAVQVSPRFQESWMQILGVLAVVAALPVSLTSMPFSAVMVGMLKL